VLGPIPVGVIEGDRAPPDADARRVPGNLPAPVTGAEELRWRMRDNAPRLDLGEGTGIGHYVQARLYSPDDRDVLFGIKLDDGGRVWLNGQKLYEKPKGWDKTTDLKVPLRAGWNTLLASVVNRSGPHAIEVQIAQDPLNWGHYYLDHPDEGVDKALPHLTKAIAAAATDSEPYFVRAEAYGRLGRFPEALADYRKGLDLQPNNEWAWLNVALLRLYGGDPEGYRQTTREFLLRFRDARSPYAVEHMARALAADPDPDPVLDAPLLEQAVSRVDAALSAESAGAQPFLLMAKGAAQYRAGRLGPALETLRGSRAVMYHPAGQAIDDLYMAMAQHRLHRREQATALFDEASDIIDTKLPKAGAANADLGHVYHEWVLCQVLRKEARDLLGGGNTTRPARDWSASRRQRRADEVRLLTAQIQADPSTRWYYEARAMVYARGGQFDQAVADWDEAIKLEPAAHVDWYLLGCTLAWQEKTDAYRARRTAMLARFAGGRSHDDAERTAKTALLMPIDSAELKSATTLIDFALSPGAGNNAEVWYPLAKGMAEYRAGEADPAHYERAIDWLTRAKRRNRVDAFVATADFYLAMAHHRLGHTDEARAALAAAVKRADAKLPRAGGDDLLVGGPVENWLICNVARREAERLLRAATSQPATRP
jgi:tetratricopeptide (TPR) repeat protein